MDASTFYGSPEHRPFTLGESPKKALLLHGFPGTPAELREVAAALREEGWQASAPLLPGFGVGLPTLGDKRWGDWRDAALSDWRRLGEAHRTLLVGFSMGGALALHLAAVHPPSMLVLIAPFWRMTDPRAHLLPVARLLKPTLRPFEKADFSDAGVRERFGRMLPDADLDDPTLQARLRRDIVLPTSSVDELRKLGRAAYKVAPRVDAPTLIFQGFQDTTVTPEHTRQLVVKLGGPVTLREFSGDHDVIKMYGQGHEAFLDLLRSELRAPGLAL